MYCIVYDNILTESDINYCGYEKCPICDKDFCNFDCIQECVVCGVETIETNYCGCETCICGQLFCNYFLYQELKWTILIYKKMKLFI